jgi:hypothetical protein
VHEEHAIRREPGTRTGIRIGVALAPAPADLAYGVLRYPLLIGHAPLDARAARDLAAHLIAAGRPGTAGVGSR